MTHFTLSCKKEERKGLRSYRPSNQCRPPSPPPQGISSRRRSIVTVASSRTSSARAAPAGCRGAGTGGGTCRPSDLAAARAPGTRQKLPGSPPVFFSCSCSCLFLVFLFLCSCSYFLVLCSVLFCSGLSCPVVVAFISSAALSRAAAPADAKRRAAPGRPELAVAAVPALGRPRRTRLAASRGGGRASGAKQRGAEAEEEVSGRGLLGPPDALRDCEVPAASSQEVKQSTFHV